MFRQTYEKTMQVVLQHVRNTQMEAKTFLSHVERTMYAFVPKYYNMTF